ncbi:MAG: exodeoxyribonuclease VII small subunit [Cellulosilyticaceae bacterium]
MPRKPKQDFESTIKELETIIREMESGELSLEESINQYKKGMELAAFCSTVLKKAEQEVYVYENNTYEKINGENNNE